jgi:tetratricopeptide (TPR) repeat protein
MSFVRGLSVLILFCSLLPAQVTVSEGPVVIPTYVAGPPDPNPFFYTGRTYQGAKGLVYPYPMYDNLTDVKENKTYTQVCLENEYVKICVLPELGGRIFEAVDKTNGYNFFYKQSVIKPALIGMLGAWISGGVEWNIPHHHRASSFMPVLYKTQQHANGAKTIWVGEMELRDRLRWAVGLTLRPGSSVLEAQVTALNTTPVQNSLLYFANVAVHTNNDYQVIFPPNTQFATQHAKKEFSRWPVADSVYNGIDFSKGVDVSLWKNHPSAISMFAWNEDDDWLAGYDSGKQAGTMHFADHHTVPGKKFFTWGTGPSGQLWDKILSDTDGPYLELMVGAWSDNQPDYSWLQPYETKSIKQYWYPFRSIGGAKNATRDAAVNLEVKDGRVKVGFHTTQAFRQVKASVTAGRQELWSKTLDIDPAHSLVEEFPLPAGVKETDLKATLSAMNRELVSYQPVVLKKEPLPAPVVPPAPPEKMKSTEELYLAGLRLEQFHSPALEPDPYYQEALKRDPTDSRANTALGILYIKRGRFADAEKLLRAAAATVTKNYTRPKDGDSLYYLGLALKYQGKWKEAEDWLQRSAWCLGWSSSAYYQVAEIQGRTGRFNDALISLDKALVTNTWNTRALGLKAMILLHNGKGGEAGEVRKALRAIDPIDLRGFNDLAELATISQKQPSEGLELVVSCLNAGLWREADLLLDRMPVKSPMVHYYRGWLTELQGQKETALAHYRKGAAMPVDYVFPFQIEAIEALRAAMAANPQDAHAPYYLGLLLFDKQPEEAVKLWTRALQVDPKMAIAQRNLAVAYSRQNDGVPKAVSALEKAISLNGGDALYLFELDRLYEFSQTPVEKRLALFEAHMATAAKRDDAMSRVVTLQILAGKYDQAIETMRTRHFHLWEGGARFNVQDSWTDALLLRGHKKFAAKDYAGALQDYQASIQYPENIEVTRAYRGSRAPETFYYTGLALEALGKKEEAQKAWRESVAQMIGEEDNPRVTVDSGAVLLYYQAMSLTKLGDTARAAKYFATLRDTAARAMRQGAAGNEFFAKFGEQRSPRMRSAQAHYVAGLAELGLGQGVKAKAEFQKALELNTYLLDARTRVQGMKQ